MLLFAVQSIYWPLIPLQVLGIVYVAIWHHEMHDTMLGRNCIRADFTEQTLKCFVSHLPIFF